MGIDVTFLQTLWFLLIAILIAGYFVLDGFDLGAGVLYPFIAKSDKEKAIVRRSVGPFWDGNEVWLLTAGGALFAAFPPAYATTFSGFYLAIMLVLFGLILRAVALEFRAVDKQWSKFWDFSFFIGSLLPALLMGVAVGNIFAGIPMDLNGDYIGTPLLGLITPFTLLCGVLGLVMFIAQGVTWLALKAPKPSELQARAAKWRFPVQIAALVVFVIVSIYAHIGAHPDMLAALTIPRYLIAVLVLACIIISIVMAGKDSDLGAFVAQSASAALLVILFAASMFPNFVVASPEGAGAAITAANSSSEIALTWMTIITCIGLPLVLLYHVLIYRTFRGRIQEEDLTP